MILGSLDLSTMLVEILTTTGVLLLAGAVLDRLFGDALLAGLHRLFRRSGR
ncbi:hypothetical protein ACQP1W_48460 [Spirillospora sp. CA-255316]